LPGNEIAIDDETSRARSSGSQHPAGRRLLGRGSIYTFGTAFRLAATLLAIPVVTRLLGSAQYGTIALALTTQLLLGAIAGGGLPQAILRLYFDHDEREDGTAMGRGLILSTAAVAFAVVVPLLLSATLWGPALDWGISQALLVGVVLALPAALTGACMALLRAQERPSAYIAVTLSFSLGAQVLGIIGLLLQPEAWTYLVGVVIANLAGSVVGLRLTGALSAQPASWPVLRSALDYGLPTIPNSVSLFILMAGDRFVIQVMSGLSAVGKYQIAYGLGSLGGVMLTSLQNAWLPITFGHSGEDRWTSLADTSAMITRLAALVSGFLALIAAPVMPIIVPADYSPHLLAEVAAIVALSSLPLAAFISQSQVLLWGKHTRPLASITPVSAALNLALVVILIPPFGLRGAAAATVLALIAQTLMAGQAAHRVARVPWRRGADFTSYATAAALVALALALPHDLLGNAIRLVAAALVAVAFIARVVAELRAKPSQEAGMALKSDAAAPAAVA
jgi:O-antigen/teichoic acid export membrane protein